MLYRRSGIGSSLQQWEFTGDSRNPSSVGHIKRIASGNCLTPSGNASGTNGAVLTLWTCSGAAPEQAWSFFRQAIRRTTDAVLIANTSAFPSCRRWPPRRRRLRRGDAGRPGRAGEGEVRSP
ncbi:RICIN domain-containing protein [Actinocorallia longicatena]|uniref:RICIN domain-containing protein n=1 Tax=Actinocorallia longicatena TaxID=111803 RepID=UPI003CD09EB8